MLKLWLLRPAEWRNSSDDPWEPYYGKALGFVVRADSETNARKLAASNGGGESVDDMGEELAESTNPWLDPKKSTCKELTADGCPGIILCDLAS